MPAPYTPMLTPQNRAQVDAILRRYPEDRVRGWRVGTPLLVHRQAWNTIMALPEFGGAYRKPALVKWWDVEAANLPLDIPPPT